MGLSYWRLQLRGSDSGRPGCHLSRAPARLTGDSCRRSMPPALTQPRLVTTHETAKAAGPTIPLSPRLRPDQLTQ